VFGASAVTRASVKLVYPDHSADTAAPVRLPQVKDGEQIRLVSIPHPLAQAMPPSAVEVAASGMADVIVLTEPNAAPLIASKLSPAAAAILPVIDVSNERGRNSANRRRSDFRATRLDTPSLSDALAALKPMIERVRQLPACTFASTDAHLMLLARLMVRGRSLEPRRDPLARETVIYDDDFCLPGAARYAEDLVAAGMMQRAFFDKLLACPRCDSGRVCVRERCSACGSTDLADEPIIHHLRCSYQAAEHEFLRGEELACPKCRARLQYFSVDYDKPGVLSLCRTCGHASSETSPAFICLDCEADAESADMVQRSLYQYEITPSGLNYLLGGGTVPVPGTPLNAASARIRDFVARQNAAERIWCLLAVRLEDESGNAHGQYCASARAFLASIMREVFTPETEIVETGRSLFALLSDDSKEEVEEALPEISALLERNLSPRLKVTYRAYAPEEVQQFSGDASPTDRAFPLCRLT
jgi:hypothetical protein